MASDSNKDKDIQAVAVNKPPQLDLFSLSDSRDRNYSNSIDIYDALPKYSLEKRRRFTDLNSAVRERECRIGDRVIKVKVKPAIIENSKGKHELVYPGEREEIIEDALRKLAVNGGSVMIDGKDWCSFYFLRVAC
ncbi:hypothetical protein [Vreelandella lionensis]|uniref:hypothetical protein n=1 Tax=Vreelandella lionensis TaxID=1144478 RepID=UPI001A9FD562|nr:hypothetical protein [Halomonas lionensis]